MGNLIIIFGALFLCVAIASGICLGLGGLDRGDEDTAVTLIPTVIAESRDHRIALEVAEFYTTTYIDEISEKIVEGVAGDNLASSLVSGALAAHIEDVVSFTFSTPRADPLLADGYVVTALAEASGAVNIPLGPSIDYEAVLPLELLVDVLEFEVVHSEFGVPRVKVNQGDS